MRRVRVLSSVLAMVALVSLAACSSGDDNEESATTTTVVASTTPTTETFTGSSTSVFCTLARENSTRVSQIGGTASNPEQLAALLADVAPAVREIVAVAPPELKGDVTTLAEGFEKLLASSQEGQLDLTVLTDPEFQTSGQRLLSYSQQVCGITP